LFRLFSLQVKEYDLYAAKATGQHFSFNVLEPERGKIFVQDNVSGDNGKLYPVATNREFALVYAVPRDIKNPEFAAEALYETFKREGIEREVDELMERMDEERLAGELDFLDGMNLPENERRDKEAEITAAHKSLIKDSAYLELKNIKREKEVKLRKEAAVSEYLRILTKKNDPYEPIEQKVDESVLKKLYAVFYNKKSPNTPLKEGQFNPQLPPAKEGLNPPNHLLIKGGEDVFVKAEDLEVKDGKVFYNGEGGERKELKLDGIAFIPKARRFYPENNIGAHILGFVGYVGDEERGRYGLEGFFDEELFGAPGSVRTGRGAGGNLIIINDREYEKARDGSDLILTINKTIQFRACQKLNDTALRHGADGGTVIIMEPRTGAILAMCSWPDYDPNDYGDVGDIRVYNNPAIFAEYEPGSIFKSITMAAALDTGKITPETVYNDEGSVMVAGWPKPIKNSDYEARGGWGLVDMRTVLEESLNTGAIFAMRRMGAETFAGYVKDFGFGEKTGIELETESAGNIRNLLAGKIKPIDAAVASFGQGIAVTPLQMAAAYAAIANGGVLMKPYLVKEVSRFNGARDITNPKPVRRVISERAAILLSGMLVNVVEGGHAERAGVGGYYVAGKTGTAQVASKNKKGYGDKTIHTFVGFAPVEEPRFVMLVKLDDPKGIKYAAGSAAPLFGEIAEFLLNYLEVPEER